MYLEYLSEHLLGVASEITRAVHSGLSFLRVHHLTLLCTRPICLSIPSPFRTLTLIYENARHTAAATPPLLSKNNRFCRALPKPKASTGARPGYSSRMSAASLWTTAKGRYASSPAGTRIIQNRAATYTLLSPPILVCVSPFVLRTK